MTAQYRLAGTPGGPSERRGRLARKIPSSSSRIPIGKSGLQTREEYLEIGLPHILQALRLLKEYSHYRFVLDQACYVRPIPGTVSRRRRDVPEVRQEGRLAIVGGTEVMCDVNMPGGESFVRQVLHGKGYFRRKLGSK